MTAKALIKKYPEEWDTIEDAVWLDLLYQSKRLNIFRPEAFTKLGRILAYNAAFMAVSFIHKERMKKCQKPKRKSK